MDGLALHIQEKSRVVAKGKRAKQKRSNENVPGRSYESVTETFTASGSAQCRLAGR